MGWAGQRICWPSIVSKMKEPVENLLRAVFLASIRDLKPRFSSVLTLVSRGFGSVLHY